MRIWRNDTQFQAGAQLSTVLSDAEQWLLGANNSQLSTRQQAFAAWGASLNGKEAAFYDILHTYMQAVGAA